MSHSEVQNGNFIFVCVGGGGTQLAHNRVYHEVIGSNKGSKTHRCAETIFQLGLLQLGNKVDVSSG